MLGMRSLLPGQDPMSRHFFIRMGGKAIPLLKEIHEHYVTSGRNHIRVPGMRECRQRLYPGREWFRRFPKAATDLLPQRTIDRIPTRLPGSRLYSQFHADGSRRIA